MNTLEHRFYPPPLPALWLVNGQTSRRAIASTFIKAVANALGHPAGDWTIVQLPFPFALVKIAHVQKYTAHGPSPSLMMHLKPT
jgi:hypothetical protein